MPLVCVAFDDVIEAANVQVPGTLTGRTSLGQKNDHALGRPFHHIALGGIRAEAKIRGHRWTYDVASGPGLLA